MDLSQKRPLGKSPLMVTPLGMGGAPLGDLYAKLPEMEAVGTVQAAYDAGVRLFDTAPLYGYGLSEARMGFVLRQLPPDSYVLSTKVGRRLDPAAPETIDRGQFMGGLNMRPFYDYSYDGAMRSFEQSLHRMGLHKVDILLIHDIDIWTHGTREAFEQRFKEAMNGAYKAIHHLREQGVVKAIGIGVNEIEPSERAVREGDLDCLMLAGRYTLLEQEPLDGLLPLLVQKRVGILLAGPLNSGILATGAVPGAKYNYQDAPPAIMERVAKMEAVCRRHGVPLAAAAIQFPLAHPAVSTIVTGAVKPSEITRNVGLLQHAIPADLWAELKHEGLVRQDAPVPA